MNFNELLAQYPHQVFYDVKDVLKRHIYRRSEIAFESGDATRDTIQTPQDLDNRRQFFRKCFLKSLGGLPASDTPLEPRIVATVAQDGFRIEKIIFQSRPHAYVTANLYIPDGVTTAHPAVLFLCGHKDDAKQNPEYQAVCRRLVRAGLIVLAQDPLGQGERYSYYEKALAGPTVKPGTYEHDYVGFQCLPLGDGITRYFLHDSLRSIDYLISRPEVDPHKIGVTGNSGGGLQTCFLMIADPRIAAAAPGTFLMNRQSYLYTGECQDAEQIWKSLTAQGFDHEDILLCMAPRPVRVLAVAYDFFPIEATRRSVQRCRRFWAMHQKETNLDLVEDRSVHQFTSTLSAAAVEFFTQHLLGKKITPPSANPDQPQDAIEPQKLWCTPAGQICAEYDDARFVFHENQIRLHELEQKRAAAPADQRREKARLWLKERVGTQRHPCPPNLRIFATVQLDELFAQNALWFSQEGLLNFAVIFRDYRRQNQTLPIKLALWDNGTQAVAEHRNWIRGACADGAAVMVLDLAGMGTLEPVPTNLCPARGEYGIVQTLANNLFWLDDSLAALRVFDLLQTVNMLQDYPQLCPDDISFYTEDRYNAYVELAGFLDQRFQNLQAVDPMTSYAQWVQARHYDFFDMVSFIIPDQLHYFDLPDLRQWRIPSSASTPREKHIPVDLQTK